MQQRYTKAADWDLIRDLSTQSKIPIVGNGDILTHFEARDKLKSSGCFAVMTGRLVSIVPKLQKMWYYLNLLSSMNVQSRFI